jgi:Sensors of blue-light using FAD
MSELWHLLYCSRQTYEMEIADMLKLLFDAREHNWLHGITGLLAHRDGRFMQLIEGAREEVHALYAKISVDPRHCDVILALDEPAQRRLFPDWQMGYAEAPQLHGHALLGSAESVAEAVDSLRWAADEDPAAIVLLRFLRGQSGLEDKSSVLDWTRTVSSGFGPGSGSGFGFGGAGSDAD